jgi:hypothetical protein
MNVNSKDHGLSCDRWILCGYANGFGMGGLSTDCSLQDTSLAAVSIFTSQTA